MKIKFKSKEYEIEFKDKWYATFETIDLIRINEFILLLCGKEPKSLWKER